MKQYVPFRLVLEGASEDEELQQLACLTATLHANWVCQQIRQLPCQKQALLEAVIRKAREDKESM